MLGCMSRTDGGHSVFFSHHNPPLSLPARPSPFPVSLTPFWHRRSHRNRIRASPSNRIRFPDRSVPSILLESWIPSHGGAHCYDFGFGRCGR